MRVKVYRSLDNPSSLLGLKGSYLILFIAALALSLFISLLFGALTSSILGTMLFLVLALGSYFGVLYMQSIWTVKDLQKVLSSIQLHSWVRVLPCRFKDLWNSTSDEGTGGR